MDKIGFGGDGGSKKLKKPRTCINGCSLKPPTHGHPCPKWPPKDAGSASVPVKGKLLVLGGCDGDNSLATSEYVCSSMEMHPSQYDQQTPPSSPYYVLPHHLVLITGRAPLKFEAEAVFGWCTTHCTMEVLYFSKSFLKNYVIH